MPDVGKFFGSFFGSTVAGAAAPASQLVDGASKIIGMFKLSPELKAQLQAQLTAENIDLEKTELAAQIAQMQGQLEINKTEAASTSWFIAGWRPATGWVCVFALFYVYVFSPLMQFIFVAFRHPLGTLPSLDTGLLVTGLLFPLLGIAGLRTIEKATNTEGNR